MIVSSICALYIHSCIQLLLLRFLTCPIRNQLKLRGEVTPHRAPALRPSKAKNITLYLRVCLGGICIGYTESFYYNRNYLEGYEQRENYNTYCTCRSGVYVIIRDEIGITVDDDKANATSTELKNDNHRPFSFFGIFRSCSADSDSISTGINITHLHSIRFYMYSLRASLNTCITCWEF